MKTSGIREFLNRPGAYLRMVENGERVAITHRGRIVDELGPRTHATEEEARSELRRRARAGRPGAPNRPPNRPDVYPLSPSRVPSGTVQERLADVRGER